MKIINGLKTCRKGLHQYNSDLRQCPECKRESSRRWYEQNTERAKENRHRWYEQNTERAKESMHRWYEQNSERKKESRRRRYEKYRDKRNALQARRRAAKKQAIPAWSDLETIKQIYAEAAELTKSTGIRHEVDHIYPLQSDYMCGLHVETNLQILTQSENAAKRNRTWPDQLDCQRFPIPKVFTPEQIALAQGQKAHS
jgi:hypothetical protein